MNTNSVNSLIQIISSLTAEERSELEQKMFLETSEISTDEITRLAEKGNSFEFLENEPDIYTPEDGELLY